MGEFLRWTAAVLIGLVLSLVLGRNGGEIRILLTLAVCVMVCFGAMTFLEPVTELISQLRRLGSIHDQTVSVLLKAAGIGLISELAGLLCADAGEQAMGKAVQILGTAAVLWLSIPLFQQILTIIEEVLSAF